MSCAARGSWDRISFHRRPAAVRMSNEQSAKTGTFEKLYLLLHARPCRAGLARVTGIVAGGQRHVGSAASVGNVAVVLLHRRKHTPPFHPLHQQ